MNYWLVKSEPFKYSWQQFLEDGVTHWDGVRNYQARNYMQAMEVNDKVLFYHSNEGKEVVGIARVTTPAYPDPTAETGNWVVVNLSPYIALPQPVSLATMRAHPTLAQMDIFRQMRLSITAVTKIQFDTVLSLGGLKT